LREKEGDDAPQNSCKTIRSWKGEFVFRQSGRGIYLWREEFKVLGKH
jgi:hypothetical protein